MTYCYNDDCTEYDKTEYYYSYDENGNVIYNKFSAIMKYDDWEYIYGDGFCYYTDINGNPQSYEC